MQVSETLSLCRAGDNLCARIYIGRHAVMSVAAKLEVKTAARHDFVVTKGEVGAEMYFIVPSSSQ
jgi:hypothetical protein|eukprot:COSAG03_NODE_5004_length_1367_cov_0.981073_1_plen_65_part_00